MNVAPGVDVVVPTHNRPDLLERAVRSVRAQDYSGPMRVLVVFDQTEPDDRLARGDGVPVIVLRNDRVPGLAGARNTGIVAAGAEYVCFLDDDDYWVPSKVREQVAALDSVPNAVLASTAIQVEYEQARSVRLAGGSRVTHEQLLASRMAMLHSSTFMIRREMLLGELGLVDETSPRGQNEDWDLLLRASRIEPVVHVDRPLVNVRWGSTSMFAGDWESRIEGINWILTRHPDLRASRQGHARLLGQLAFGQAALGRRRDAFRTAISATCTNWREPRALLACAVASRVVSAERLRRVLHRRGHGI